MCKTKCGTTGKFRDINYFYLSRNSTVATPSNPIVWQVQLATVIDTTKISQNSYIVFSGIDTQSDIEGYNIMNVLTQPTSWFISEQINMSQGRYLGFGGGQYKQNGTYYVWIKDKAGNISNKPVSITNIVP